MSNGRRIRVWDDPMCKCDNCDKPKAMHTAQQANNCKQALSMRA